MFCFEMEINDGLLFVIGGYSVQHLSLIFANEYVRYVLYPNIANNLFLYFLICLGTIAVLYVPYMLIVFYMNRNRISIMGDRKTTTVLLLLLTVVLYSSTYFFQNYFRSYGGDENVIVVSLVGDMFVSIMLILTMFLIEKSSLEKKEKEFMELMYVRQKNQYDTFRGNVEYMNVRLHDLKYELKRYADDGMISIKTYEEMSRSIKAYEGTIETGNDIANMILSDIIYICQKNDISFSPLVDGRLLDRFDQYGLYVLLSNIFDNAITYVSGLDKEKRYIRFTVEKVNEFLVIKQSNYLEDVSHIKFKGDGTLTSTKKDKKIHGYGTKSMKLFAEKNNGSLNFSTFENEFVLTITFPL